MLLLPRHVPEGPCALPEDEFAARLVRLVPALDATSRAELLQALFPVPSANTEEPTASLIVLAIARLRAEGSLKERTNEFLARHPYVFEDLKTTVGAPPRAFAFFEAAAWLLAFVLGSAASVRAFSDPIPAASHRSPHALVALTIPPPPAFDPPSDANGVHRVASVALPAATSDRSRVQRVRSAAPALPHPRATPFHNIDFSGYFPARRHRPQTVVAMDPPPAPAPSPTAQPRPRVHSLFGPLFGPHMR